MLWYSVGVGSDFDNWDITDRDQTLARYYPYWYGAEMKKVLDKTYTDLYLKTTFKSVNSKTYEMNVLAVTDSFYIMTNTINTVVSLELVINNAGATTRVWSMPYDGRLTQIEVHAKSDTANGCIEIYVNNVLVTTYTGKVNPFNIVAFGSTLYGYLANAASECIITDEGRIGNKNVMLLPVNGRGTKDPSDYIKYTGVDPRYHDSDTCAKGYTYLSNILFKYAGTVSEFVVYFSNPGTYSIGIFTKTGTNKFKRKYFSDSFTIGKEKIGLTSFVAGIDFPDGWDVTPQDTIGIFSPDANLSFYSGGGSSFCNAFSINANAFSTDAENTFASGKNHPPFLCKYYVDVSHSYEQSTDLTAISSNPETFADEKYAYCELSADGQEVNYSIANLQQGVVNTVDSIRIHADCSAGATLTNGKITLNVNGVVTESNVIPLTSTNTRKTFQIDKLLTASEINGALIGFKAYK